MGTLSITRSGLSEAESGMLSLGRHSSTGFGNLDTEVALRLYSGTLPEDLGLEVPPTDELLSLLPPVPEDQAAVPPPPPPEVSSVPSTPSFARRSLDSNGDPRPVFQRISSLKIDPKTADAWGTANAYLRSSWQYQKTRRAAAAAVLSEYSAESIEHGGVKGIQRYVEDQIRELRLDDTVYVYDLGNIVRMWRAWQAALPRVTPHYAVKCNPEPAILKLLLALGSGFDCASQAELATVLGLGVPASRIIFAHPCKRPADITFAATHQVEYTTFDTISELEKMAAGNPRFRCVLRIRADDPTARVQLGLKYGADMSDAPKLLEAAKGLGLQVVGVSFHVGSAAKNLRVFRDAIVAARHVFDMAELMGFHMELLDIGGGFAGQFDAQGNVVFGDVARVINETLDSEFPEEMGVRVIAEPGRYFAETSATLFTPVYGQRDRQAPTGAGASSKDYWITDGLYGSFNCMLYDGQNPEYRVMRSPLLPPMSQEEERKTTRSTIWGPTCDSADCVYKDVMLPPLRNGDWLMFPNAGAYTVAGACDFNGINMTRPRCFYVFSDSPVDHAEEDCGTHQANGVDGVLPNGSSHTNGSLEQHKQQLPPDSSESTIKS